MYFLWPMYTSGAVNILLSFLVESRFYFVAEAPGPSLQKGTVTFSGIRHDTTRFYALTKLVVAGLRRSV